jgi:predicted metal-binding membrane protein
MRLAWLGVARNSGELVSGFALLVVTALAWMSVVRDTQSMSMVAPGVSPSVAEGAAFCGQWGVMMAAMMLPSAAPMILLYRTVSSRLSAAGERVIPGTLFTAVYLLFWLLFGVPVYGAYLAVGAAAARWPSLHTAMPYLLACVLAAAGIFQFSRMKRTCLHQCESPLGFLIDRWRSGYIPTLRLAAQHAAYCIGCCWGLMVILVAAGAMSLPWVLGISIVVFAEKLLPRGGQIARVVGVGLIALAIAVALHPELAGAMRGHAMKM